MGRTIGPKNKIARRFGINLGLKTNPTKVAKRLSQPPGVHGPKKHGGPPSGFGKQLLEKQKAKFMYGIRERQFHRYMDEATKMKGDSGVTLNKLLERRLDNVVYRMGFAVTRAQARQLVTHGMFLVNKKNLNIPSHLVSIGDVVSVKPTKAKKKFFAQMEESLSKKELPSWLTVDPSQQTGKVTNDPAEKDFEKAFDVKLIVEYYSSR